MDWRLWHRICLIGMSGQSSSLMIIATMAALHDVAIERLYKRETALHNRPAFIGTRAIS